MGTITDPVGPILPPCYSEAADAGKLSLDSVHIGLNDLMLTLSKEREPDCLAVLIDSPTVWLSAVTFLVMTPGSNRTR